MTDVERSGTTRGSDGVRCYLAGILFPIIFLTSAPYKSDRFIRFQVNERNRDVSTSWEQIMIAKRILTT